ncbi:FHA domain-containing protein [Rhodopirellula sp. SWK7]|uniref:FHA domain-containing protein n=1 Tax=Rhodopirellula sp. SWK7 TaxID=595460 RepID=UPI000A02FFB9|nr:FHA domain-containing protein [Rhodopirellula sp. SWK7]
MPAPVTNRARLVLSTGSRAGLRAPIHPGFYLIGRDKNCQIRPKTRSVSRVHCLLYFGVDRPRPLDDPSGEMLSPAQDTEKTNGQFYVIDLNSTSGTKVDGEKIKPRKWVEVGSGTELRCGKMAWQVAVEPCEKAIAAVNPGASKSPASQSPDSSPPDTQPEHSPPKPPKSLTTQAANPVPAPPVASRAATEESEQMLSGSAWQGADVAAFLAAHDEADREVRYENIRAKSKMRADESGVLEDEESLDEGSQFLDSAVSGLNLATTETVTDTPIADAPTLAETPTNKILSPAERKAEAARAKREAKKQKANDQRAARRAESVKRTAALDGENPMLEKMKLVMAVALTVAVLAFGVYQFIQFRSGPPARVVDGID